MKKTLILILLLSLAHSACQLSGCVSSYMQTPAGEITYKDVPGVTEREISAIEKLKSENSKFIYGMMNSTEAYMLPDGSYAGYAAEFCGFLSRFFGVEFELEIFEWDELIAMLDSGGIDFTGELTPNEERMRVYNMSRPIAERMLRIFKREDAEHIKTESDTHGLKLGFLRGSLTADSIKKKAYPTSFERVDADNFDDAAEMIRSGAIDAFIAESVSDTAFEKYGFIRSAVFFPMIHESVSLTAAKNEYKPIISVLDKYIEDGGIHALNAMYTECEFEYGRHKFNNLLTDGERAYIEALNKNGAAVAVAYEHDNYPVDFYNEKDGEFQGVAVDVLDEISRLTGLIFEPAVSKNATWAEIYEALAAGEVDMAAQLLFTEEWEKHFIWSETPYAGAHYALLSKADYPELMIYQVARANVGALNGSGKIHIYNTLFPGYSNLTLYDTQNQCLDALERGEIDLFMASEYSLLMQTNYREKSGFKINIMLDLPMKSHFGFHKDAAVLCSIIDKAQRFVRTDKIEIDWTGRSFDYSKKLAEAHERYLTVFIVFMFLALVITVFALVKNVRLGKVLKNVASSDVLTGVSSRRYFMEQSAAQIARSFRLGKECFIIIYDLDHFKAVNDTYGHSAGDKVLREIAQRLRQIIRPYDLFGRYGGEEFAMLMCDIDEENVAKAAERLRQAVCGAPVDYENKAISISASFGVARVAADQDLNAAINAADEALYRAKNEGRNRVVYAWI